MYEESQNAEVNANEKKKQKKLIKLLNYVLCWRENKQNQKVFSQEEKESIMKSEQTVLNKKIFKLHLTNSQKQMMETENKSLASLNQAESHVEIQKQSV